MTNLPIKYYDWIGDLERQWLATPMDQLKLQKYEKLIGTRNMRHLITCDRELGWGFMSGGIYARTKLRKLTNNNDEMRWRYIVGMLDYYYIKFSQEKPDFVFFNEFTMSYELGAYFIAQALKIPCSCIIFSRFGNMLFIDDNPYNIFTSAAKLFEASKTDKKVLKPEYIEAATKYIEKFQKSPDLPLYSKILKKKVETRASLINLLKTLSIDFARWIAITFGLYGTSGFLRQRNGFDILKMNLSAFVETRKLLLGIGFEDPVLYLNTNYIYYPLHVEPESSTMIQADKLTNQLMIIEQLAKSMPAGYKLLVKEHIPMLGMRPKGFYSKIRNMPDVHLITPFADSFSLIKHSKLTAVITGTAGWEAILLSKPTLVMGHTQYNMLNEGFIYTIELASLEEIIYNAIDQKPAKRENLIAFVAATLQQAIHIPIEVFAHRHFKQSGTRMLSEYKKEIKLAVDQIIKAKESYQGKLPL